MKISFSQSRSKQVPAIQGSFGINLNCRDPCPIYETSVVRVFVCVCVCFCFCCFFFVFFFPSFSIFSDRRSLKIEDENSNMETMQ